MSIPPHLLAQVDRHRAAVADLVDCVREHQADCGVPEAQVCCGTDVLIGLNTMDREALVTMLLVALGELARYPAPPTTLEDLL